MRIQIERVQLERLLANERRGNTVGIDTDEKTADLIDKSGRSLGSVNIPNMTIIETNPGE